MSAIASSSTQWDRLGELVSMDKGPVYTLAEHLGLDEIQAMRQTNKQWHTFFENGGPINVRKSFYRNMLFSQLLPGIKEEQLPCNLTSYDRNTKEAEWEKSYKAISNVVYGRLFYKSIGVRALSPEVPIPQYLLERKYLPTHSIEVPVNSALSLTESGQLTEDPKSYAPLGHRYHRPLEGIRTLEFPNTQYNRDFLEKNLFLKISYPMLSPLEQGSPLIEFSAQLEIDVAVGSKLWSIDGKLTEDSPAGQSEVNKTGQVRFLDNPTNWLILAQPALTDPTKKHGPNNPYTGTTKYLKRNAKPVILGYFWKELKIAYTITALSEWKAPFPKLLGLNCLHAEAEEEANQRGLDPFTFQQDSIHRVLTQIRGNPDLYPDQFSRASTKVVDYKVGTFLSHPLAADPATPVSVNFDHCIDRYNVGLSTAWSLDKEAAQPALNLVNN